MLDKDSTIYSKIAYIVSVYGTRYLAISFSVVACIEKMVCSFLLSDRQTFLINVLINVVGVLGRSAFADIFFVASLPSQLYVG